MKVFRSFLTFSKKALLVYLVLCVFMFFFSKTDTCFYLLQKIVYGHEFLTAAQAEKKWGRMLFDATKFRTNQNRKEMVADIIRSQILIGLTYDEVKTLLGNSGGGYYISDEVLTYHVFVAHNSRRDVTEAYSLLVLTSDNSDLRSRVDRVYLWKDR